jgi:hypothetical protein
MKLKKNEHIFSKKSENNLNWDFGSYLDEAHLEEWKRSGIDNEEFIRLNVRSLSGNVPYEYLHYSDAISRRNDGRLRDGTLKAYGHIESGGWWCGGGADPLNDFLQMEWGCFKPDKPRLKSEVGKKDKPIKYEHPLKTPTRTFLLFVTESMWEKVSKQYKIEIPEENRKNPSGFWRWVWLNNVPIVITEGAKKAASLLNEGYAAVGIPGIFGGYRTPSKQSGNTSGLKQLIPELVYFATPGRIIYICFDYETKFQVAQNVKTATRTLGWLFERANCHVHVVELPGPEKGVDDFKVANGVEALESLISDSKSLKDWNNPYDIYMLPKAHLTLDQKYLGSIEFPDSAKILAIKSPKGTGKTELIYAKSEKHCLKIVGY